MAAAAASPPTPTAAGDHARLLLRGFLSPEICKELEFVHRSCGTAGYRPSVVSTSLPHLAATSCGHLLLPFVPVRERLRDAVDSFFSCHFDLFVEFTGLISWCKGASIGRHSDDNKPYLRQRAFTAVCYLNNHGKDYKGGTLRFQGGEPSFIEPVAGDVVIYTADNRNVHCVDELRITCIGFPMISLVLTSDVLECAFLGLICTQAVMKITVHLLHELRMTLRLGRGVDVFEKIFANSLHTLQVVQFYYWKAPELAARRKRTTGGSETVCYPIVQVQ